MPAEDHGRLNGRWVPLLSLVCSTPALSDAGVGADVLAGMAKSPQQVACDQQAATDGPVLRVMTLNAAHGRRDGPNQLFLGRSSFVDNLAEISALLREHEADIVALQEVDGPSRWSGMIDHAQSVARSAEYPWQYRGDHATSWLFQYGTALLSRLPLSGSQSHRFAPSPPTPRKGYVSSRIELPGAGESAAALTVDVLSVHFDYLSRRAQQKQLAELAEAVADRDNPVVVLGDFNSTWHRPDSTVRALSERTGLAAFDPESKHLATHRGERIDWILISEEFRFKSYRVLAEIVSDHLPVVAEIGLAPISGLATDCAAAVALSDQALGT